MYDIIEKNYGGSKMEYISPEFEVTETNGISILSVSNETPFVPFF